MNKYTQREEPAAFDIESGAIGQRIYYPSSKLLHESTLVQIVHGPWCVSAEEARRWWTSSETARWMREGRPPSRATQ